MSSAIKRGDTMSTAASVLGVIGGVFALLNGGYHLWIEVNKTSETVVTNTGSSLEVTYDPTLQTLEFAFIVLAENSGTKDDVIKGGTATLESDPKQIMSSPLVTFYESQSQLPYPPPFPVRSNVPERLRCVVRYERGRIDRPDPPDSPRLLRVILNGDKSYDVCFRFNVTDDVVSSVFNTEVRSQRQFPVSYCPCGANQ